MIITDKEKMVLTPTYYVFKIYVPFQDATFVPVTLTPEPTNKATSRCLGWTPIAPRDTTGKQWLEFTNVDPDQPIDFEVSLTGVAAKTAKGETLTAPKVRQRSTPSMIRTPWPQSLSPRRSQAAN